VGDASCGGLLEAFYLLRDLPIDQLNVDMYGNDFLMDSFIHTLSSARKQHVSVKVYNGELMFPHFIQDYRMLLKYSLEKEAPVSIDQCEIVKKRLHEHYSNDERNRYEFVILDHLDELQAAVSFMNWYPSKVAVKTLDSIIEPILVGGRICKTEHRDKRIFDLVDGTISDDQHKDKRVRSKMCRRCFGYA
jgi:hypothetical protein